MAPTAMDPAKTRDASDLLNGFRPVFLNISTLNLMKTQYVINITAANLRKFVSTFLQWIFSVLEKKMVLKNFIM